MIIEGGTWIVRLQCRLIRLVTGQWFYPRFDPDDNVLMWVRVEP